MNEVPSSIPTTINEHGENINYQLGNDTKMDHIWLDILRYLFAWLWGEVWVGQKNIHVSAGLCPYGNKEQRPTD